MSLVPRRTILVAVALLFLVTEELLVEAHETAQAPVLTGAFFAGFLLFLILGMHN